MVESNKNKSVILGAAAAAALVGAALLYHYVFAEGEDEEGAAAADIMSELQAAGLDTVKKAPNGMNIAPDYIVKLLNFVTTTARKRRDGERKEAITQRREAYKAANWEGYRDIVKE